MLNIYAKHLCSGALLKTETQRKCKGTLPMLDSPQPSIVPKKVGIAQMHLQKNVTPQKVSGSSTQSVGPIESLGSISIRYVVQVQGLGCNLTSGAIF